MSYVSAIVVAAGRGLRLKSKIPKPLVRINKKPLISYSLNALRACPWIKEIILVANRGNRTILRRSCERVVLGGRQRRDSVKHGLKAISRRADLVLIHDAARPFIDKKIVSKAISAAKRYGAAVVGVPVKSTIKKVVSCQLSVVRVKETINRKRLWEIQTPQVFRKDLILKAYRKFASFPATDDAMLVEKLGKKVYIVPGSYSNIKITTPEDLLIAGAIAKKWKNA